MGFLSPSLKAPVSSAQPPTEDITPISDDTQQPIGESAALPADNSMTTVNITTATPMSARKRARIADKKAEDRARIAATWKDCGGGGAECSPTRERERGGESSDEDYAEEVESSDEEEEEGEADEGLESGTAMECESVESDVPVALEEIALVQSASAIASVSETVTTTVELSSSMRSTESSSARTKCKPLLPKTPTKPAARVKPVSGSIFPNGKTAAEVSSSQAGLLRRQEASRSASKAALATKKKAAQNQLPELSPVRGKAAGEGRPSIGTMTTQWEFMRSNFVGNSDEELEWMMVSKNPGAYRHAHRKNVLAEDRYYKSMHDTAKYQGQLKYVVGPAARIPPLLSEMLEHAKKVGITNLNPQANEALKSLRGDLKTYVDGNEAALAAFSSARRGLEEMLVLEDTLKLARRTIDTHDKVVSDVQGVRSALAASERDGDLSLASMEKWAKRERETDDYAATMREEDDEWLAREREPNLAALAEMWSFVPVNVAEMTVAELMASAVDRGGLLSLELATEIKNNRFLHWLVTHVDDIASASFLSGDKKAYFENLEAYDLVELRALAVCLPAKFENDNDGKKAEWRSRFIGRAKQIVSQANGDQVKGAWDEALGRRAMADMAPLKPDQERRALYYYRTKKASAVRVAQYEEKSALLLKKEGWLANAETAAAETKTEYDTVLRDMRDPDFLEQLSAQQVTQLTSVKDRAKRDYAEAESKRKNLSQEVSRLRKTIADAPVSKEQFLEMERDLTRHLKFTSDINWEMVLEPIKITGVFDSEPEILKVERHAAKFSSAEEEAALRKRELTQLKNREEDAVDTAAIQIDVASDDAVSRSTSGSNLTALSSPAVSVVSGGVAAAIRDAESSSAGPAESQSEKFQTPRGKRNSVLNANPELLNTLNKMFSPPAGSLVGPSSSMKLGGHRRHSTITTNLFAAETAQTEAPKVKVIKKTQSKLLMKLLNNGVSPKKAPVAGGAPLSFLDQIKAKKAAAAGGGEGAPVSFLDQLKGGFKGLGGRAVEAEGDAPDAAPPAAAPMSFLEQIKMRKQKQSTAVEETAPTEAAPPPPVAKKMSFLESIQSRRVD
eukprot:gene22760-28919_t